MEVNKMSHTEWLRMEAEVMFSEGYPKVSARHEQIAEFIGSLAALAGCTVEELPAWVERAKRDREAMTVIRTRGLSVVSMRFSDGVKFGVSNGSHSVAGYFSDPADAILKAGEEVMRLEDYDVSEATHNLRCAHQLGRSRRDYTMPCIPLEKTKTGMVKLVVFGERDWAHRDHIKHVRYVPMWRIAARAQAAESE